MSLPVEFNELAKFAGWALPAESQRIARRMHATQLEIVEFYDAMTKHFEAIIRYLNQFPLNAMPDEARNVFLLLMSLAEVAPAVDCYDQPRVIDGFDPERFQPVEHFRLRPQW